MFPIGEIDDFKIYLPRDEDIELGAKLVADAESSNHKYLSTVPASPPSIPITGSFIYAHPPDYRGNPMLNAGIAEWKRMFQEFVASGIDTVVFQAALWQELNECYYNSKVFTEYKTWDVIEPMLQAAKHYGLNVFLGGYGSIIGWREQLSATDLKLEIKRHLTCYQELLEFQDQFDGFYFPCETAYIGHRLLEKEKQLNHLHRTIFTELKNIAPDHLILISPGTKYFPDTQDEFKEAWSTMLDNVPLDIIAPQDSIGTCGNALATQSRTYQNWKDVTTKTGTRLWGNIELFQRTSFKKTDNFVTAAPNRVQAQLSNASPFVEKIICWEAMYFTIP